MNSPRIIATDMDGTLLGSDGQVSPRNLAALREAERQGMEIVIATGRRHSYAMRVLRDLGLHHANALVSSNGTVIRTVGAELVHRHHMPVSTAQWLCDHVRDFRSTLVLTFDMVGPDGEDPRGALVAEQLEDLHTAVGRWMQANEPYFECVPSLEHALGSDAPIQMMLCGTVERMAEAEALLAAHPLITPVGHAIAREGAEVTLHRTAYPERDLCILDILPAGVSKASALQYLVELRGCRMDDVLAIGDNWNDLPMLAQAGRAVLMSNAPEDLKAHAREQGWTIGASNDEDGVALALEPYLTAAAVPSR